MRHKVADLEGKNLDAAVALAEGWRRGNWGLDGFRPDAPGWTRPGKVAVGERTEDTEVYELEPWPWSTDWAYGGPIIDRERISLISPDPQPLTFPDDSIGRDGLWHAEMMLVDALDDGHELGESGAMPLIAAMRAYVASRFGEKVEL